MQLLRTPDARFENLIDYPFQPNYVEIQGIRIHYVDEGKHDHEILLMLHGEPTWSYLYRKMIPIVVKAGYRVIAPDLVGFGKSDKPASKDDYSYQKHVDWITEFVQKLDLQNITLVCQDWGGLIGLRIAAENEARFKRICTSNTFLPTGDMKPSESFLKWQEYSQTTPEFNIGKIVSKGCVKPLSDAEIQAYNAPFPDESYKMGARIFPMLVPISSDNPASEANRQAWKVLQKWNKPFLTCNSDSDPITRGSDTFFQKVIPGAQGQAHITLAQGGHFVQEDQGENWANKIVEFIQANP
jgi:haloalkane dehalogenase